MILLDTNIISELMKPVANAQVIQWVDGQDAGSLYLSTVTVAEISYGLHALPEGKRRNSLENSFNQVLEQAFNHRILPFDEIAASYYGKIMGSRKLSGKPLSILDGQIAAIARAHHFAVATRNIKDFADCGLELINPFLA